jgi:hypothetical protein
MVTSCFEIFAALFLLLIALGFVIAIAQTTLALIMRLTQRTSQSTSNRDKKPASIQSSTARVPNEPRGEQRAQKTGEMWPGLASGTPERTSRLTNRAGGRNQIEGGSDYHHGIYHPYRGGSNMDFMYDGGYSASIVFGIKRENDTAQHRSERRAAVDQFCSELAPLLPDDCLIT